MIVPPPNLDDRSFHDLTQEALERIRARCPRWTDLSPHDPGVVLLEVFAHLTEVMIYRLNRLPRKAYIAFLNLIGARLQPPAAARARLRFQLEQSVEQPVTVPRGTRVSVGRVSGDTEPPVFTTAGDAVLVPGTKEIEVLGLHADVVEGELAGLGTGLAGQSVVARRPPIIAPTLDGQDLIVGVETTDVERGRALKYGGKTFRIWTEVENFSEAVRDRHVYVADRMTGTVTFAPEVRFRDGEAGLETSAQALAAVPPQGREIRLWYRRGGGLEGNVAAGTLTVLKDAIPGVQVTNPAPATGGRPAETLENALLRGPLALRSLEHAVTARDFELIAERTGAISRAKAFARRDIWVHAPAGIVEVVVVPYLPGHERPGGAASLERLQAHQTAEAKAQIAQALEERRPLGTVSLVTWARFKTVRVTGRVVVTREEDPQQVGDRIREALHRRLNPLPGPGFGGWPFGRPLQVAQIYEILLSEPGVVTADQVRLFVDEVPDEDLKDVCADAFQPHTWYAARGETVFRSQDDGEGWEPAGRFPGETVGVVEVHPDAAHSGLVAVATKVDGENPGACIHLSEDCGETWRVAARFGDCTVQDLAWMSRGATPVLWLATDRGLYELALRDEPIPVQVRVDPERPELGFWSVVTTTDVHGEATVCVAGRDKAGVFISRQGGWTETFRRADKGLSRDLDIRTLAVQAEGTSRHLWAGTTVPATLAGEGCFRYVLGPEEPAEGWVRFSSGWKGGTCNGLAFQGGKLLAATYSHGVLELDLSRKDEDRSWVAPGVECGLPLRGEEDFLFHPVVALATGPSQDLHLAGVAGGQPGVYRRRTGETAYEYASRKEFNERITLPRTWLFCSGEHDIVVEREP